MMYEILARYYDALVKDDEATEEWVSWVESWNPGRTFLELACGSGEITRRLGRTHALTAMDLSQQMVDEADRKAAGDPMLCAPIEFRQGNMEDLSGYGLYDAIGCFCDSFNYILRPETVKSFFAQVHDHLNAGGLFFFDTHSMDRLEEFGTEEGYEETGAFEDGTQVQWVISAEDSFIYQDFAFYLPQATLQEHHMQRVYDPAFLQEALEPYFEILSVTTDFDQEGIQEGEKYFYVCRRKEPEA